MKLGSKGRQRQQTKLSELVGWCDRAACSRGTLALDSFKPQGSTQDGGLTQLTLWKRFDGLMGARVNLSGKPKQYLDSTPP